MTGRMTRRQALGAAAVGGAGLVGGLGGSVEATAATSQHTASHFLPDVWGEDFMLQWSPPDDLQKDLNVGASHVRLSCHARVLNPYGNKDQPRVPWTQQVQASREAGYSAVESFSWGWDTVNDNDIRESRDWP